jgi:dTDP-4-amino-4,6-dideoxygalactose transaminase
MRRISELARRYDVRVIEDASHAIGGKYDGKPVGCCEFSDIAVFSFHPVKIITSGEGGAATTKDPALAARMARLRSHGITRDAGEMTHPPDGPWYYQQIELGWNYRLTDIQAALGRSQLGRANEYVLRRNELADWYDDALSDLPISLPGRADGVVSAFHLYVVRVPAARHREIFEGLRARGIGVNLHYIPIHLQPYYRSLGFEPGHCPEAERYYAEAISLPLFPTMTDSKQVEVATALASELAA